MKEKLQERAFDMLEQLAAQLNVTIEQLWAVLIKQASVEAAGIMSILLLGVLVVFVSLLFTPRSFRRIRELQAVEGYTDRDIPYQIHLGLTLAASIAVIVSIMCNTMQLFICWFNPEYFALQKLLSLL